MFSKMCDLCQAQPAVLFFRTFNGESIGEEGLCPQCAMKRFSEATLDENQPQENEEILHSINAMRNILSDIVGHINKISITTDDKSSIDNSEKCPVCQSSSEDIDDNMIGCSQCFETFQATLKTELHEHSYGQKHLGKVPARLRKDFFKEIEIEKLKIKLQSLIREEAYEEAAKIQKRISKLEG
ncbi:MAG: UvrB/UvrC motif-containing protein [Brevinema sp.]